MIITISGHPGSGKTTVGELIAKQLNLEFISTGHIFRDLAKERGHTLKEFSKLAETDQTIDQEVDRRQKEYGTHPNIVIEGRLAAHFIPHAKIKIWIECSSEERASRISGREGTTLQSALSELQYREASEQKRYKQYYNINIEDIHYDIILNSTNLTAEQTAQLLIDQIRGENQWISEQSAKKQKEETKEKSV